MYSITVYYRELSHIDLVITGDLESIYGMWEAKFRTPASLELLIHKEVLHPISLGTTIFIICCVLKITKNSLWM